MKATHKKLGNRINCKKNETECFARVIFCCFSCITLHANPQTNITIDNRTQLVNLGFIDLRLRKYVPGELRPIGNNDSKTYGNYNHLPSS